MSGKTQRRRGSVADLLCRPLFLLFFGRKVRDQGYRLERVRSIREAVVHDGSERRVVRYYFIPRSRRRSG